MSAIELAQSGLAESVDVLVTRIRHASAEEAKQTYDQLGVAREWAKLQEDSAQLAERLVWLEAVILRRIGELGSLKVLPAARRTAARHFATLDDGELTQLLTDYPARSAVSAFNLWAKAQGVAKQSRRGRALLEASTYRTRVDEDDENETSRNLRMAIESRVTTVRQAAALLIDEYAAEFGPGKTVSSIVDDFIDDYQPLPDFADALEVTAFRKGLSAAVREAFMCAPVEATERSWEIPAFITTFDEQSGQWCRIPSEFATVDQARQMLRLRRGQAERLTKATDALQQVLERRFRINEADGSDYLRNDTTALSRRLAYRQKWENVS